MKYSQQKHSRFFFVFILKFISLGLSREDSQYTQRYSLISTYQKNRFKNIPIHTFFASDSKYIPSTLTSLAMKARHLSANSWNMKRCFIWKQRYTNPASEPRGDTGAAATRWPCTKKENVPGTMCQALSEISTPPLHEPRRHLWKTEGAKRRCPGSQYGTAGPPARNKRAIIQFSGERFGCLGSRLALQINLSVEE